MATLMFSELVWKNNTFNLKNYAWPSVDSCSDYNYIKNFLPISYVRVVTYSCKSLSSNRRNHEHARDFQRKFSSLIFEEVYLTVYKFLNRMITSGLNNVRSKTDVVKMTTLPKIQKHLSLSIY